MNGHKSNVALGCCQTADVLVGPRDSCQWVYDAGEAGTLLECDRDFAVAGVCGSGSNTDCPEGSYFGVYCCPYSDER